MKGPERTPNGSRRDFLKNWPRRAACDFAAGLRRAGGEGESGAEESASGGNGGRKVARLDITGCLAWAGLDCQLCYLACPLRNRAIFMQDAKPVIVAEACDGCALCITACRMMNEPPALRLVAIDRPAGRNG